MHVKHVEQSADWSVGSLSYDDRVIYETKWKEEEGLRVVWLTYQPAVTVGKSITVEQQLHEQQLQSKIAFKRQKSFTRKSKRGHSQKH